MASSESIPEEKAITSNTDTITSPSSATTHSSIPDVLVTSHQQPRRRSDRDQFSLALDPVSSNVAGSTSSSSSSKPGSCSSSSATAVSASTKSARRPSSVFEHVNGMIDRFGRRLHSRSEARGEISKRPSSSVLSLVTPPDTAKSDCSEAISFEDDLSPGGSNLSHTFSAQQDHRQSSAEALARPSTIPEQEQASYFYAPSNHSSSNHATSAVATSTMMASSSATMASESESTLRAPPSGNSSSSPAIARPLSVIDRVLIQVTEDNERFSVVDISGLNSAAAVKERMLSKLHLFDEDPGSFALSRTEIGAVGSTGPRLDDDELLAMCWEYGDEKGNLKFLLHQIAPPSTSAHAMMPPPMHQQLSPRIAMRDIDNGSSTANTATTPTSFSRQEYSKTPSASSRSSVGEQSAYYDNGEGPSEGGPRSHVGSSRAKLSPLQRRNNTNSQSMVEASRQYSFSGSDASYTSINHSKGDRMRDSSGGIEEMDDAQDMSDVRYDHVRRPGARMGMSQSRHSAPGQGQWEMDGSTVSSTASSRTASAAPTDNGNIDARSRPPSYRTTSHPPPLTSKSISINTAATTSPTISSSGAPHLPRSLLAGNTRDAAQMYTSAQDMYSHVPQTRSSVGPPHDQQPDPTQRSHSANMFARRPSTSDARIEMRPFSGSSANYSTNGPPSAGSSTFASQPASAIGITSPISPLSRPPDRERSSSFGGGQMFASAQHPTHQVSMHDLRSNARPAHQNGMPMPRPFVGNQQQGGAPPNLQGQYGTMPNMRSQHGQFGDRRYMGPAPPPGSMGGRPHLQEFGARNHGFDPRMNYSNVRPSTPSYDRGRYPPPGNLTPGQHQHMPGNQVFRDEAYMAAHFPASNTRLVSEFQRSASSAHSTLQPGMTVQESLQHQHPPLGRHPSQAGTPLYRPASPYMPHQAPNMGRRSESMTSSLPSGHPTHMSGIHGPRDARPPPALQTLQPRPHAAALHRPLDARKDSAQAQGPQTSSTSSTSGHMPASMEYYYNPATPSAAPSVRVHASTTSPSQNRTQDNTAASSITQSPQHVTNQTRAGKASERSSGSSFNTSYSSSHTRVPSLGDGRRREGEYSAPTSARSSRTSRSMSPKPDEMEDSSELPYTSSNEPAREGSLTEEDLLRIRPLPRLPATQAHGSSSTSNALDGPKDEDTFKADQWKNFMQSFDDDGTARAESKKNKHLADVSAHQIVAGEGTALNKEGGSDVQDVDVDEGTFKTFDDEDGDDDEGGTWAQPLDTARQPNILPQKASAAPSTSATQRATSPRPEEGTLKTLLKPLQTPVSPSAASIQSPRRPILTLNIEPTQMDSPMLIDESNLANLNLDDVPSSSSQGHQASASTSSSNHANIGRSLSFARRERGDWAFRPPPSQLYENLDDFFPKHDLDRPVIDPATGLAPNSPQAGSPKPSDVAPMTAMVSPSINSPKASAGIGPVAGVKSRIGHQKSIRIVAQDRKRFLERAELADKRKAGGTPAAAVSGATSGDLARRRSTKLWGGKVIEVTPGTEAASATGDSPTSSSSSDSKPVFKWVKGDLIGKGTYGRVYLALNATTGEMIAVKQVEMPTTDSDREDARQKSVVTALKSEIETLKDLDHPNIVSYLGFEETRANLSIFLEYVPGGSVGSCLRKHGKLDEATIKSFLQQILNGLNYLHGRGILHRDLKADNLLVDYDGIVKISDFGTVRKSEDIYGNVASMSMQGSIFWMAPEVVSLSRTGYSAKVDIWSLGCVVLEMFAGRRPWSDEEAVQAMFKIGAERRAPPIPPDVRLSKAAAHFLKTCFAVEPNERPTASRLLDHVFPHAEPGWRFAMSDLYKQLHR